MAFEYNVLQLLSVNKPPIIIKNRNNFLTIINIKPQI
jgi:hypothetical protein